MIEKTLGQNVQKNHQTSKHTINQAKMIKKISLTKLIQITLAFILVCAILRRFLLVESKSDIEKLKNLVKNDQIVIESEPDHLSASQIAADEMEKMEKNFYQIERGHQSRFLNVKSDFYENEELLTNFQQLMSETIKNPDNPPIIVLDWYGSRARKSKPLLGSYLHLLGQNFIGDDYLYKLDDHPNCGGCYFTSSRIFEKTADGIVISLTAYGGNNAMNGFESDVPSYFRNSSSQKYEGENIKKQYWLGWFRESGTKGVSHAWNLRNYGLDSKFNFTVSYRSDSDIPYNQYWQQIFTDVRYELSKDGRKRVLIEANDDEYKRKLMENKYPKEFTTTNNKQIRKAFSVWIVSNCDHTFGSIKRMKIAKLLKQAGLRYDGFGSCFKDSTTDYPDYYARDADKETKRAAQSMTKYKFYFSFENGIHCNDYISEKFWRNSLKNDLVPIVFGPHKNDVKNLAPPNSYIHVEDYYDFDDGDEKNIRNLRKLVDYLYYLDQNDTAYLEYHAWRWSVPDYFHNVEQVNEHGWEGMGNPKMGMKD